MNQPDCYSPDRQPEQEPPGGDPWHAFGYLVAGVALYGFLGWLADRWLGTSFMVAIGILIGAGLGLFQTFARFGVFPNRGQRTKDEEN